MGVIPVQASLKRIRKKKCAQGFFGRKRSGIHENAVEVTASCYFSRVADVSRLKRGGVCRRHRDLILDKFVVVIRGDDEVGTLARLTGDVVGGGGVGGQRLPTFRLIILTNHLCAVGCVCPLAAAAVAARTKRAR